MSKLGKFIAGCGFAGAVAAGVYYYLEKTAKEKEEDEFNFEFDAADEETENDDAESEAGEEAAERMTDASEETEETEETEEVPEEESEEESFTAENAKAVVAENITKIQDAAARAYTTIRRSSGEAAAKVREKIGPKGEEVIGVAKENAGKIKEAVADSAVRIRDILQKEEVAPEETEEFEIPIEEEKTEETPAPENAEGTTAAEETSEPEKEEQDAGEEESPEETVEAFIAATLQEMSEEGKKSEKVVDFFDDEKK